MKKKKKLNVKQLVLEHCEKAVLGIALLIFFAFAYSFFGHPSLPSSKEPPELMKKADEAVSHMATATWDAEHATKAGIVVTDYVKRSKRELVNADSYLLLTPFDRPIKESKRKRSQPKLFAVEQLRVSTGLGPFQVAPAPVVAVAEAPRRDAAPIRRKAGAPEPVAPPPQPRGGQQGGSNLEGRHWVMVTGLVPLKKQVAAFEEAFKDTIPVDGGGNIGAAAADRNRDSLPQYQKLIMERCEIVDGKEGDFKPMDMLPTANFLRRWASRAPDVVSLEYVDPRYTMPLGPRVDGSWGEEAAHPKEIPLATEEELESQKLQEAEMEAAKKQADMANAEDPFAAGGGGPVGGAQRRIEPQRNAARPGVDLKPKKVIEYRLFRFTDYTVEPGKSYRYRVKLAIRNPNYQLLDKFLKSDVDKKSEVLETPISAASPPASVGTGEGVLVAAPELIRNQTDVSANVVAFTIEPETGLKTKTDLRVNRGSVVNVKTEVDLMGEKKEVEFYTNNVVLDIRGGRSLPGRDKSQLEPSEVLFWNSNTKKLEARNEVEDAPTLKELEAPPVDMTNSRGGYRPPSAQPPMSEPGMSRTPRNPRGGPSILEAPVGTAPGAGKTSAKKTTRPAP